MHKKKGSKQTQESLKLKIDASSKRGIQIVAKGQEELDIDELAGQKLLVENEKLIDEIRQQYFSANSTIERIAARSFWDISRARMFVMSQKLAKKLSEAKITSQNRILSNK